VAASQGSGCSGATTQGIGYIGGSNNKPHTRTRCVGSGSREAVATVAAVANLAPKRGAVDATVGMRCGDSDMVDIATAVTGGGGGGWRRQRCSRSLEERRVSQKEIVKKVIFLTLDKLIHDNSRKHHRGYHTPAYERHFWRAPSWLWCTTTTIS